MEEHRLPELLKLSAISETLGPELKLERVAEEFNALLGGELPGTRFRIVLWDERRKCFAAGCPEADDPGLRTRLMGASGPFFNGKEMIIPLVARQRLFGMLACDACGNAGDKERVIGFARLAEIVLSNAAFYIESEIRGMDMFRFNVLSRALNPTVNEDEVLKILAEALAGMIKFDACAFLIFGKKEQTMLIKSRWALPAPCIDLIGNTLSETVSNLTNIQLKTQNFKKLLHLGDAETGALTIRSQLSSPLITKDKVVGIMAVFGFEHDTFSMRDQRNLSLLSSHGAVAFENAMLYGDLKRTYFSIINALASAIEAKDEYTRGHSDLVSRYSVAIASAMKLSPSTIESIQIAGLLHDLGKIGVPEDILGKNGKLTDGEYDIVKEHPGIAMKILGPVEFPHFGEQAVGESSPELTLSLFEQADLSADVKLMIYHHHEKYSGGGYPKGLVGEEIPLGARILSVADTFEALTANRPYRKAFPVEEAMKILRGLSGTQLDPRAVEVFDLLVTEKGVDALKETGSF